MKFRQQPVHLADQQCLRRTSPCRRGPDAVEICWVENAFQLRKVELDLEVPGESVVLDEAHEVCGRRPGRTQANASVTGSTRKQLEKRRDVLTKRAASEVLLANSACAA
jgi:hypothetical protein